MGERIKLQSCQMVASSMRSKCVFIKVMTYLFPDDSVANFAVKVLNHYKLLSTSCWSSQIVASTVMLVIEGGQWMCYRWWLNRTVWNQHHHFFLSVKQQIRTRNDTLVKFEDNDANDSSFSALLITIMTLLHRNPWYKWSKGSRVAYVFACRYSLRFQDIEAAAWKHLMWGGTSVLNHGFIQITTAFQAIHHQIGRSSMYDCTSCSERFSWSVEQWTICYTIAANRAI